MGEAFETSEIPVIRVEVKAQHDLKWLTLVKNNKDWYQYGGEAFRSRFTIRDEEIEPGESSYYLRVEFEGMEMAWSSPIWVNYKG